MINLRLKKLRNIKGLTQAEVAMHLHITREAYSRYENNEREMTYETLIFLADFFSVSVDYLLGRQENNSITLNEHEMTLIHMYRELDERGQNTVKSIINYEHGLSAY